MRSCCLLVAFVCPSITSILLRTSLSLSLKIVQRCSSFCINILYLFKDKTFDEEESDVWYMVIRFTNAALDEFMIFIEKNRKCLDVYKGHELFKSKKVILFNLRKLYCYSIYNRLMKYFKAQRPITPSKVVLRKRRYDW